MYRFIVQGSEVGQVQGSCTTFLTRGSRLRAIFFSLLLLLAVGLKTSFPLHRTPGFSFLSPHKTRGQPISFLLSISCEGKG